MWFKERLINGTVLDDDFAHLWGEKLERFITDMELAYYKEFFKRGLINEKQYNALVNKYGKKAA